MKVPLPLGKVNPKNLREYVLNQIQTDESVLNPPAIGEDGTVFRTRQNILVAAADPITGIKQNEKLGKLSVLVNANDIYVHAAAPRWFFTTLLLPPNAEETIIKEVMKGVNQGLRQINANLVGGHTELTKKVSTPIISGFFVGEPMIDSIFIRSGGGKVGDHIIMTKGAGIEGTSIIATDCKEQLDLAPDTIRHAKTFEKFISVKREVEILVNKLGVEKIHAMHDATEGGVLGAAYELAEASKKGFKLWGDQVLIREETKKICKAMKINPLELISSGTLIATLPKSAAKEAVNRLKEEGIEASIIGTLTDKKTRYLLHKGEREKIETAPTDAIWSIV